MTEGCGRHRLERAVSKTLILPYSALATRNSPFVRRSDAGRNRGGR